VHGKYAISTLLVVLLIGCSATDSSTSSSGTRTIPANPCLTTGASYLCHFEVESGNCPSLADQVVNVNPDGTITLSSSVSCTTITVDGCSTHESDCHWSYTSGGAGCNYTSTSEITVASDGSSASGLVSMTASCNDGETCAGTYQVSYARQ
jgi:hypothetical protein